MGTPFVVFSLFLLLSPSLSPLFLFFSVGAASLPHTSDTVALASQRTQQRKTSGNFARVFPLSHSPLPFFPKQRRNAQHPRVPSLFSDVRSRRHRRDAPRLQAHKRKTAEIHLALPSSFSFLPPSLSLSLSSSSRSRSPSRSLPPSRSASHGPMLHPTHHDCG